MTIPIYDYAESRELEEIEQKLLPKRVAESPFLELFPFDSKDSHILEWDQLDNFTGLQQWRGYNGAPLNVQRKSRNRYLSYPGVYGEKETLNEEELTNRRANASYSGGPIPISDLVAEAHTQLLTRRLNLIEKIVADLAVTGAYSVSDADGAVVYRGSYTQQQITPGVPWSTLATATPLADMRTYRGLEAGQSVHFGVGGYQLMKYDTANLVLNNNNPADLGGKKAQYGQTINGIEDLNKILVMNDVPPIKIYNGGYIDDTGTWNYYIPLGKVVVVGRRLDGSRIGRYRFTRNLNSPNAAAAPYVKVITDERVPSKVEVHDGHNGGPLIQFPGTLIKVNAA